MTELFSHLGLAMKQQQPVENVWDRIHLCMEARRRLVESQRKHEIDMGCMLSADQARQWMAGLATIVREESLRFITDTQVHRSFCVAVNNKFAAIFGDNPQPDVQRSRNF